MVCTTRKGNSNSQPPNEVPGGDPTGSESGTEHAPIHTTPPPATKDNIDKGTGAESVAEGAQESSAQAATNEASSFKGTSTKHGSTLAGLSFRKVTLIVSEEGNAQDRENDVRQGKHQRTGSVSHTPAPEPTETTADPLLNYQPSPAPSPPPENPITPATLPSELAISSTNAFIARLEAKAAKAAEPIPAALLTLMSDNTAMFTPHPEGGFPPVQGRNSTFPFDNINHQQLVDWLKLPGPRVFAQPLAHRYYPPHIAQEIVGVLKDVIGDILGHTNVKITAPIATLPPANLDHAPYTYLIRNISVDDAAKLAL
jgi:hypothetical protein